MLDDKDIEKLIKVQEGVFVTKHDFDKFKDDIVEFKDEILEGQDEIFTKLTALSQEKTVGDEQDKRQKKVPGIHNTALKSKGILSKERALEIAKLRVF